MPLPVPAIAVLPFENLSPDPDNAYFAAGIHDTVLHELAKISDMNVIARTSVMQYANTTLPVTEIANTLNVGSIMEGTVQYAEGQVRITAQLINPETGAHIWSGNFDRPFADVFTIQSDIAQSIANAIGAELLPRELQQITRQQTASEEAFALYLQAKALIPNIAPFMNPDARQYLQQAIELDPTFAEPYAVLAFHYALSLGTEDYEYSTDEREMLAREYANTAIRLNDNIGLAYGALAIVAGANFNRAEETAFWEEALLRSPNDVDVLDDVIRYLATKTDQLDRAAGIASRIQTINPSSMATIQIWLAQGSGDFSTFLGYMNNQVEIELLDPVALPFFLLSQAIMETVQGNKDIAANLLDDVGSMNISPAIFFYTYLPYANGRLGRLEQAQQQYDIYLDHHGGELPLNAESIYVSLGIQDEESAVAIMMEISASDMGPDSGVDTNIFNLANNYYQDPVLDKPEFIEARRLLNNAIQ